MVTDVNALTPEAHAALHVALVVMPAAYPGNTEALLGTAVGRALIAVDPQTSPQQVQAALFRSVRRLIERLKITEAAFTQMVRRGMEELEERGIVECKRDGVGDRVPYTVHLELLESSMIVAGDLQ